VYKHYKTKTRQDYVWLPDEILGVNSISKARGKKLPSDVQFRQCVDPTHRGHHLRALFRIDAVRHLRVTA
jgi:hypothetical protein